MLIVLPSKANTGSDNTRGQLGLLAESDGGRGRFLACTISPRGHPVYVHAKVAIVDDRWMTIGSANLNEHSLFNDTEVNISVWDTSLAQRTRRMLWAEHLETTPEALGASPTRVIDEWWWPVAEEQLRRRRHGIRTHRVIRLEHVTRRSDRLVGPLQNLLVDG